MSDSFGPWTTTMHSGTNPALSEHWRMRLIWLQNSKTFSPHSTVLHAVCLVALATSNAFMPTIRTIAVAQDVGAGAPALVDAKPSSPNEVANLEKLSGPCDVDWVEIGWTDCLRYLGAAKEFRIELDEPAIRAAKIDLRMPVTLRLSGAHVSEMLQLLLEPLQLDWIVTDQGLLITTATRANQHVCERSYDIGDLADEKITAAELSSVIAIFAGDQSLPTRVEAVAVESTGRKLILRQTQQAHRRTSELLGDIRQTMRLSQPRWADDDLETITYPLGDLAAKDLPIEKFISRIETDLLPSTWMKFGGPGAIRQFNDSVVVRHTKPAHERLVSVISTLRRLTPIQAPISSTEIELALRPMRGDTVARSAISAALDRPVSLDFRNAPLTEVARRIRAEYGVFLWFDTGSENRNFDLSEIDPISLRASGVSLRSALKLILEPCKLDWRIHKGCTIRISTANDIDATFDTIVYRVKEVVTPQLSEAELVAHITTGVNPKSWDTAGGNGVIRALPGLLFVRQNRRGHEAVAEMLSALAAEKRE
jgi:hypothetical protein